MYKSDIINLTQCEIKEFRNKLRSDLNFVDHHSTKKKSIVQIDSNGNIICVFKSANNAAEILNLDCSSIVKVCKCRLKQTQGYYFSYIDAVDEDSQVKIDF
jgi:hypothetical protein